MYGCCLSVVLHSLWDDRAVGVEQVSIFMVFVHDRFLTYASVTGTGFIAPTTTSMHHVGSKYSIAVSIQSLCRLLAGMIMANLIVCYHSASPPSPPASLTSFPSLQISGLYLALNLDLRLGPKIATMTHGA